MLCSILFLCIHSLCMTSFLPPHSSYPVSIILCHPQNSKIGFGRAAWLAPWRRSPLLALFPNVILNSKRRKGRQGWHTTCHWIHSRARCNFVMKSATPKRGLGGGQPFRLRARRECISQSCNEVYIHCRMIVRPVVHSVGQLKYDAFRVCVFASPK